jgi:polyhydroxyalkanoate synthesis regulator phasin
MTHIEALQKIVQLQDLLIAEQKDVLFLMEEVKALSKQIQELQNVF